MLIFRYLKNRQWATLLGYALFTGMMAVGYYYNVTFVQLGLMDLGTRLVGMSKQAVSRDMALLALLTCLIALGFGWFMTRRGWGLRFWLKLRLAFLVVLLQTILTTAAPLVRSEASFLIWIVFGSLSLGVGVPTTFSMTSDLIPRRDRGYVAAAITAAAYFFAPVLAKDWHMETFRSQLLPLMALGALGVGLMVWLRPRFLEVLAQQHTHPEFARGRFVRLKENGEAQVSGRLWLLILLMFGIFFIDSLGFLRVIATPTLVQAAWLSPEMSTRLFIGGTHVAAALVAGILYSNLDERQLFLWIFGIFALTHFMYVLDLQISPARQDTLAEPMLYAIAVSLYTVVNFAIWADVSTPASIGKNAAVGVALSGWTATFLSTALALRWEVSGVPLEEHLRVVESIAILLFLFVLILSFMPALKRRSSPASQPPVPAPEQPNRKGEEVR